MNTQQSPKQDNSWLWILGIIIAGLFLINKQEGCNFFPKPETDSEIGLVAVYRDNDVKVDAEISGAVEELRRKYEKQFLIVDSDFDPQNSAGETPGVLIPSLTAAKKEQPGKEVVVIEYTNGKHKVFLLPTGENRKSKFLQLIEDNK